MSSRVLSMTARVFSIRSGTSAAVSFAVGIGGSTGDQIKLTVKGMAGL